MTFSVIEYEVLNTSNSSVTIKFIVQTMTQLRMKGGTIND